MSDFLIIRLLNLGALIYPNSFCLGAVEVRPAKCDTPEEKECFKEALEKNNEKLNLDFGTRVACIIKDADNLSEALNVSQALFEESLDVMSLEANGMASLELMKSGIARDLTSNKLQPLVREKKFSPSNVFVLQKDRYPKITQKEYILLNKDKIDLCGRFLKSLHWSRHASWEQNLQMQLLFNWFSVEALLKVDKDDDVAPKAMLAMGFPIGSKNGEVPTQLLLNLEKHPNYKNWKKIITKNMKEIRDFRNNSVHSGFRLWDISEDKMLKYSYLMKIACSSCHRLGQQAISSGCETTEKLWEDAPKLLDEMDNLVKFVHGTLIYSLEKKTYTWI